MFLKEQWYNIFVKLYFGRNLNENTRNEFDTQNEKVDDDSFVQEDSSSQNSDASLG